jgi:hypothetical protein
MYLNFVTPAVLYVICQNFNTQNIVFEFIQCDLFYIDKKMTKLILFLETFDYLPKRL